MTDPFDKRTFIKGIKGVLWIAAAVIASALAAALLLCAVYLLPVDSIDKNVEQSARIIKEEGAYPKLSEWFTSQLDNYTDAIMLLEAANRSDAPVLNRAMSVYRGRIEGKDPAKTLVAHYIRGEKFDYASPYARYWHGYLVFLKPLLQVLDYGAIRTVNGIVQAIITAIICCLMVKRNMGAYVVPFLITYGMLMPAALAKALQYSSCFYVFSAGIIALLLIGEEKLELRAKWVFLFVGIGTAFFDLLTYPIATFGIPAVFCMVLTGSGSLAKKTGNLIRNGFFWGAGYGGMWVSKWILASVITGENVLANGAEAVLDRTSRVGADGVQQIDLLQCEGNNFARFFTTPITGLLIIFLLYLAVKCMIKRRELTRINAGKIILPYIVTGLAPVVWFAVAVNHSQIHTWFTNKACAVSVLAVCFALVSVVQAHRNTGDGSMC